MIAAALGRETGDKETRLYWKIRRSLGRTTRPLMPSLEDVPFD
jgi:hypothetical protein